LLALRALHEEYGHIQEIIVQNFRAKPGTRMEAAEEPDLDDLMWTIALARLVFGSAMNIQAPPNLSAANYGRLLDAGINDWGGVSPVTPDHVNPEAPWPQLDALRRATAEHGKILVERLAAYPPYCLDLARWQDGRLHKYIRRSSDVGGYARADSWTPGALAAAPETLRVSRRRRPIDSGIARADRSRIAGSRALRKRGL